MYALSEGWQLTNKSKANPFLSVMFAINLIAENLILHIFLIIMIIIPCSGMFHVPDFIDARCSALSVISKII